MGLSISLGSAAVADTPPGTLIPTDAQWEEMTTEVGERLRVANEEAAADGGRLSPAVRAAIIDEVFARVSFAELDLESIRTHWPRVAPAPNASEAVRARLLELAAAPDVDGANAAITLVQTVRRAGPRDRADAVTLVLSHPALDDALREDVTNTAPLAGLIGSLPPDQREAAIAKALSWSSYFSGDLEPDQLPSASAYADALLNLGDAVDAERFQAARRHLLAAVRQGLERAEASDTAERVVGALQTAERRLDSPIMRNEFMDHVAPSMTFTWIHDKDGTPDWKSLDDLRGKVVILDFWATWCGPCIASFPNIAALREKYSSDELVIIGVTSIQNAHHPRGRARIDTSGDPAREKELMAEYMEEMEITWTVAFTEERVFNPDYNVRGIPHLTIIDAEGRVRHNGLHPSMPMERKSALLDPLIAEARAKSVR